MRLTKKYECGYEIRTEPHNCGCGELQVPICKDQDVKNKLGQLEDIEEELEIDLIVLFEALKNGVYYYSNQQLAKDHVFLISKYLTIYNDKLAYDFMTTFEKKLLLFKDYGKTWALTKEELENDK